ETDKATQEFESNEAGVIVKILVQPGTTVPIGTPICIIAEDGEDVDVDALVQANAPASSPAAAAEKTPAPDTPDNVVALGGQAAPSAPTTQSAAPAPGGTSAGRVRSSPLARK